MSMDGGIASSKVSTGNGFSGVKVALFAGALPLNLLPRCLTVRTAGRGSSLSSSVCKGARPRTVLNLLVFEGERARIPGIPLMESNLASAATAVSGDCNTRHDGRQRRARRNEFPRSSGLT